MNTIFSARIEMRGHELYEKGKAGEFLYYDWYGKKFLWLTEAHTRQFPIGLNFVASVMDFKIPEEPLAHSNYVSFGMNYYGEAALYILETKQESSGSYVKV